MYYEDRYLFRFESSNGKTREIRVLHKEAGDRAFLASSENQRLTDSDGAYLVVRTYRADQRAQGRAPVLRKQQNGPIHGTSLTFYAECLVDREFMVFYTSDPKEYRVDVYEDETLLWQGYITPELYSEPDIAPPYDVEVVATDGIGELKLYNYEALGTLSLRALLTHLLGYTGLPTDVYLISSLKAGSRGAGALLDMTINLDYMAGKTCYETLTYILDTLHATITWWKGAWILTRETNVTFTSGKVRYFNTAGNSALLADSVQVLGKMYSDLAWPVGQLSTVIDPAKNRVAVQAPWHVVTCLQNSDMTSDASWAKNNDASYGPDGYLFPNNDEGTSTYATAYISQALAMEGLRVPMSFELRATGVSAQVGVRVGAAIGVLLTYTVGNVVYHLHKGSEGTPEWTPGPAIGTSIDGSLVDYQRPLASFDMDRIQAETLQITDIPAFVQGTSYPAGTLTVYILGTCARVYAATLDVVLPRGYQDILRIGNGARGEGNEVEVAIGRETTDNAYYAAFLRGLLLDSGNLITSFADANFPAGMDYLAFIARDYALSVALPRAKVTGTVYLESGIAAPPLVFVKGALNYWLQTWSWNLYEDELEIEGLTLPSASLTVESETILEANGSTVSSAGSAGSSSPSSSMGGSANYFELAADPTLVQLRQAYSYLGIRKGLVLETTPSADVAASPAHLMLVNKGTDSNPILALYTPLPLITGGDQILIDGTPGGGGGAGAGYLYELNDVYSNGLKTAVLRADNTAKQNGDALVYNSALGKWVAAPVNSGVSSVALETGTANGTLRLTVNGVAGADVAVNGLGSLAYKSNLDASDIPSLSYLPLGGGTMYGTPNVSWGYTINANTVYGLYFKSQNPSATPIILTDEGKIRMESNSATFIMATPSDSNYDFQIVNSYAFQSTVNMYGGYLQRNFLRVGAGGGSGYGLLSLYPNDDGCVAIGTTASLNYKLYVNGTICSIGDQILSSDASLKTNLKPITLSAEQIADAPAVTFDWKDGHGHSFGSIAQYWKPVLPEMVRGEEGSMTLAYAQGAMVSAIALAKEVVALKNEIRKLKGRAEK